MLFTIILSEISEALKGKNTTPIIFPLPPIPTSKITTGKTLPPPLPPPLPAFNTPNFQAVQANLPRHLKPKKKFPAILPMKKANWVAVNPRRITENAFWTKIQDKELASDDIISGLYTKLSLKPIERVKKRPTNIKTSVQLRVLNVKSAQNIAILLHSSLKSLTYEQIKQCILDCDTSTLNSDTIQQLIRYLPKSEQLQRLQAIKNQGFELSESERFVAIIAEVDQLVPRLESIDLKLRFDEIAKEIETDTIAGITACQEIRSSEKFGKILELLLLFGNIMNSSSSNAPAFGFEMSYLIELSKPLFHHLIETIERKFPEVLSFNEELKHSAAAACVSFEKVNENMQQITSSLESLNKVLEKLKQCQPQDKFYEVMSDEALQFNDRAKKLEVGCEIMKRQYEQTGEYFTFDISKCPMEDFFCNIKKFILMFTQARREKKN